MYLIYVLLGMSQLFGLGLGVSSSTSKASQCLSPLWEEKYDGDCALIADWLSSDTEDTVVVINANTNQYAPVQIPVGPLPRDSIIWVTVAEDDVWSFGYEAADIESCGAQTNANGFSSTNAWCVGHSTCVDGVGCAPAEAVELCLSNSKLVVTPGSLVGHFSWDSDGKGEGEEGEVHYPLRSFVAGENCFYIPFDLEDDAFLYLWAQNDGNDGYKHFSGSQTVTISYDYAQTSVMKEADFQAIASQTRVNVFPLQALIGTLTVVVLALVGVIIGLAIKLRSKAAPSVPTDEYLLQ